MRRRPRRNRKSAALREVTAEAALSADRFVWPVFLHEGREDEPFHGQQVLSMACARWQRDIEVVAFAFAFPLAFDFGGSLFSSISSTFLFQVCPLGFGLESNTSSSIVFPSKKVFFILSMTFDIFLIPS